LPPLLPGTPNSKPDAGRSGPTAPRARVSHLRLPVALGDPDVQGLSWIAAGSGPWPGPLGPRPRDGKVTRSLVTSLPLKLSITSPGRYRRLGLTVRRHICDQCAASSWSRAFRYPRSPADLHGRDHPRAPCRAVSLVDHHLLGESSAWALLCRLLPAVG